MVVGTGGEARHLNPETSTAGLAGRQGALLIGAGKLIGASLPGPNQNIGYAFGCRHAAAFRTSVRSDSRTSVPASSFQNPNWTNPVGADEA